MTADYNLLKEVIEVAEPETYAFCRDYFNEPVLVGTEVYRLIGYGEAGKSSYYILRGRRGEIWYDRENWIILLDCLKGENARIGIEESIDDGRRLEGWLLEAGITRAERLRIEIRDSGYEMTLFGIAINRSTADE